MNTNVKVNLYRKTVWWSKFSTMGAILGQHHHRIIRLMKERMKESCTLVRHQLLS